MQTLYIIFEYITYVYKIKMTSYSLVVLALMVTNMLGFLGSNPWTRYTRYTQNSHVLAAKRTNFFKKVSDLRRDGSEEMDSRVNEKKSFVASEQVISTATADKDKDMNIDEIHENDDIEGESLYDDAEEKFSNFQDFSELLPSWIVDRCKALGFTSPTKVQQRALPVILEGKDVILQAQTGSGKTLAYGLPLLSKLDPSRAAIQAVVVVPTRELGLQVSNVLRKLAAGSPKKIVIMPLVEGSQNRRQHLWAVAEPPHVVVGNPRSLQRIVDLGRLRLNAVSYVVLDEVDACLINPDTRQELHVLLSRRLSNSYQAKDDEASDAASGAGMTENLVYTNLAAKQADIAAAMVQYRISRQTIMCSATIPQRQHFASACRQNGWTETIPELIHVSSKELVPKGIRHEYVECPNNLRLGCLKYLIKKEAQEWSMERISSDKDTENNNYFDDEDNRKEHDTNFQIMIFLDDKFDLSSDVVVRSVKEAMNDIKETFQTQQSINLGKIDDVVLMSENMHIDDRSAALNAFRLGNARVLICSDMLSRGIDIPSTSHVIQLQLPSRVDTYLHRSGRVGRNGRPGKVITIISGDESFVIARYSNELGIPIKHRPIKITKK